MTTEPTQPIKVFVAYAEEDELLKDKLERNLAALKREGLISV